MKAATFLWFKSRAQQYIYSHQYQWPVFVNQHFVTRDCFLCNGNIWEKIMEVGARVEIWQRWRGGLGGWCMYCRVTTDPCLFLPVMVKPAEVLNFTFLKYTQNMHMYTDMVSINSNPNFLTTLCILPADPSLYPILSKQMSSWLRFKLPVLPVYPVQHLFSSCSHAHLCDICVWVYWAKCHPCAYAVVLTDLLWQ